MKEVIDRHSDALREQRRRAVAVKLDPPRIPPPPTGPMPSWRSATRPLGGGERTGLGSRCRCWSTSTSASSPGRTRPGAVTSTTARRSPWRCSRPSAATRASRRSWSATVWRSRRPATGRSSPIRCGGRCRAGIGSAGSRDARGRRPPPMRTTSSTGGHGPTVLWNLSLVCFHHNALHRREYISSAPRRVTWCSSGGAMVGCSAPPPGGGGSGRALSETPRAGP